jgi:heme/copper-type cytochrome/quinol oxidase subunit 2
MLGTNTPFLIIALIVIVVIGIVLVTAYTKRKRREDLERRLPC